MAAMHHTFDHPVYKGVAGSCLFQLRQGKRSVADYAIEYCILTADSGWNAEALMTTFQHGFSSEDELAT